jgi:hypothetical protein
MKPVLIVWKDIVYKAGWNTQKEFDEWVTKTKHHIVNQVGFIIEDDEDQLVIVDSYFEDKSAYGTIHKIPKGCIISITVLGPAVVKKKLKK